MKPLFYFAFFVSSYLIVSTMDYNDQVRAEADKPKHISPARIYSKRCEREGKRIFATQADGGLWIIRCVDAKETKA